MISVFSNLLLPYPSLFQTHGDSKDKLWNTTLVLIHRAYARPCLNEGVQTIYKAYNLQRNISKAPARKHFLRIGYPSTDSHTNSIAKLHKGIKP